MTIEKARKTDGSPAKPAGADTQSSETTGLNCRDALAQARRPATPARAGHKTEEPPSRNNEIHESILLIKDKVIEYLYPSQAEGQGRKLSDETTIEAQKLKRAIATLANEHGVDAVYQAAIDIKRTASEQAPLPGFDERRPPDIAPKLWKERQHRNMSPAVFIMETYRPWLGIVTLSDIRALDPQLAQHFSNWKNLGKPLPDGFVLRSLSDNHAKRALRRLSPNC